jgi:hypothetical protein
MNGPLSLSQWRRPKQDDLDVIPSDVDQTQFPVLFARNDERNAVRLQNRGDRELLSLGGWVLQRCRPPSRILDTVAAA